MGGPFEEESNMCGKSRALCDVEHPIKRYEYLKCNTCIFASGGLRASVVLIITSLPVTAAVLASHYL